MKYTLLFLLSIMRLTSYSQDNYEIIYSGEMMPNMIKLSLGKNCFRIEDTIHGMIKTHDSKKWYAIKQVKNKSYVAAEIKPEEYLGSNLFKKDNAELYPKIDTIFNEVDTLISNILCRKISINYIQFFERDDKTLVPYDTIFTNLYVSPNIGYDTPFRFTSSKVKGVVLKFTKAHPTYSVENDKAVKSYLRVDIFSEVVKVKRMPDELFKIPKGCIMLKNYEEFLNIDSEEFSKEMNRVLSEN